MNRHTDEHHPFESPALRAAPPPKTMSSPILATAVAAKDDADEGGKSVELKTVKTMRKYRSQTLKDYQIMIEYKHLKHHAPRGMYVLPSFTDRRCWHGVVFLRQGLYKRGIFKFIVSGGKGAKRGRRGGGMCARSGDCGK